MQYAHTDDALALSHAGRGWRAAECTLMRAVRLLLRGVPSRPHPRSEGRCASQPFYLVYSVYDTTTQPQAQAPAVHTTLKTHTRDNCTHGARISGEEDQVCK